MLFHLPFRLCAYIVHVLNIDHFFSSHLTYPVTFFSSTVLLLAVAISLFGAKAYLENKAEVLTDKSRDTDHILLFGWSFWVAVGSTALSLIASILYFCVGRNEEEYN